MEHGYFKRRDGGGHRDFDRPRDRYRDPRDQRDQRDRWQPRDRDEGDQRRGGDRYGGGGDRYGNDRYGGRDAEESVFSKKVRAGRRRTYFFDVRKTRGEDYFITITESTKRDEGYGYRRHKIFLYKEDFNRFVASLNEVVNHVKTDLMPDFDYEEFDRRQIEWETQNRDQDEDFDDAPENDDAPEAGSRFQRRKDDEDMAW